MRASRRRRLALSKPTAPAPRWAIRSRPPRSRRPCAPTVRRMPAADRLGEDEPRPPGNRRRRRRSDQGAARAQARADSRRACILKRPNPNIDFAALEAARADHARTVSRRRTAARIVGRQLVRLRRRQRARHSRGSRRRARTASMPKSPDERAWPLVLSARSEDALRGPAVRLAEWIEERIARATATRPLLPDLAYTLGARRNHHAHRLTVVAQFDAPSWCRNSTGSAVEAGEPKVRTVVHSAAGASRRASAFVMSGQGPQWWGMGRELMRNEPVFRETHGSAAPRRCSRTRASRCSRNSAATRQTSQMQQTEIAPAGDFRHAGRARGAVEIAGASSPPPSSATASAKSPRRASPAFSAWRKRARVIVLRARFMHECARGDGTMLAVGLSRRGGACADRPSRPHGQHRRLQRPAFADSGRRDPRSRRCWPNWSRRASSRASSAWIIRSTIALMQPAADALDEGAGRSRRRRRRRSRSSAPSPASAAPAKTAPPTTGAAASASRCSLSPAVNALADFGVDVWLEISAHPALSISIQECLAARGQQGAGDWPRPAANASTTPSSKPRWICIAPAWRSISRR